MAHRPPRRRPRQAGGHPLQLCEDLHRSRLPFRREPLEQPVALGPEPAGQGEQPGPRAEAQLERTPAAGPGTVHGALVQVARTGGGRLGDGGGHLCGEPVRVVQLP